VAAGTKELQVASNDGFVLNYSVVIDPGSSRMEVNAIEKFGSIILRDPLMFEHPQGAVITMVKHSGNVHDDEWNGGNDDDDDGQRNGVSKKDVIVMVALLLGVMAVITGVVWLRRSPPNDEAARFVNRGGNMFRVSS